MRTPVVRPLLLCTALLMPLSASADALREGLWEVTVRMEIGGQPATAEPLVVRQCINQQSAQDLVAKLTGADVFDAATVTSAAGGGDGIHLDAANTRAIGEALAPIVGAILGINAVKAA